MWATVCKVGLQCPFASDVIVQHDCFVAQCCSVILKHRLHANLFCNTILQQIALLAMPTFHFPLSFCNTMDAFATPKSKIIMLQRSFSLSFLPRRFASTFSIVIWRRHFETPFRIVVLHAKRTQASGQRHAQLHAKGRACAVRRGREPVRTRRDPAG